VTKYRVHLYLGSICLLFLLVSGWYWRGFMIGSHSSATPFDGQRAYRDIETQVGFGPRIPGSAGHATEVEWLETQLRAAGWAVHGQQLTFMGHEIHNVIASRSDAAPQIVLGAHYDTRIFASRDPNPAMQAQPVPGADDGASGVAVLLELARTIPSDGVPKQLVFFDAEDNGDIPGWDWLLGSRAFISVLQSKPRAMVLLDMVGDPDLNIPMEATSDPALRNSIWETARRLGYDKVFVPQIKYSIEDDHTPFLEAGIPAVDIIDLDYAYWHTTADLPEHVSAESLQTVGDVVWTWLRDQASLPK
jgi:Zn-dependent M28 family amino/carboxypeptidase